MSAVHSLSNTSPVTKFTLQLCEQGNSSNAHFVQVMPQLHGIFYKKQTLWLQPPCFSNFVKSSLKSALNLKTSNDNNNPEYAIMMQEKGCSGIVRHVMDVHSILLLVESKFTSENSYCKILFETQPAYVS